MITDNEIESLILALQSTTQASRLNKPELREIIAKILDLGYSLSKSEA
jgi:hypothetical protein